MILMLRHVTAYMVGHLVLSTDAGFFCGMVPCSSPSFMGAD